jgi:uncharacterized protein involved in response to NO
MSGALWSSGFRPFFLLGTVYGPVIAALWYGERLGWWMLPASDAVSPLLLHAHEFVFGFACAIVCGVLLTALPSWAGAAELRGAPLAMLALLWCAGRAAFLLADALPRVIVILADCALFPVLGAMLVPALSGARKRLFLWTVPPLVALAAGNIVFHFALARSASDDAQWGIALGMHALAFLFSLYGGLLTPAFTRNFLRARGERAAAILVPLEYATAFAMVAFAAADLTGAPPLWMAMAAFGAVALHTVRCARWRGWRTAGEPLLWTLHLGYAWLIAAIALRGISALSSSVPQDVWIHAFTLGALGMTMLGLMTRVVLRHTGRPLRVASGMRAAYFMMLAAALLRLAYSIHGLGEWAVAGSSLLWAAAFVAYLVLYGAMLVRPSLPRAQPVATQG